MTIKLKKRLTNLAFLLPALLLFGTMVVLPFISGAKISFTDWDGFSEVYNFVGMKNYLKIFKDPTIGEPIKNSLFFTAVTVIGNNLFGLLLAMALKKNTRVNRIFRTFVFMPFIISLVLTGFIWSYIYSDVFYELLGIKSLLGNKKTVMLGICIMGMWRDIGYAMLIYLAGLNAISDTYYEAAEIDGAGPFTKFRYVTLPMIAPAMTINITLFLGWGLKVFDYAMTVTHGGPGRASETFALYVYNYTFPYNKAGYGQAAAIVMMAAIVVITGIVTFFLRRREVDL
ncbi:carbohydrate ABC transporter permease [Murimonas intestini]|uniref:Raffinose/stachyose/melibiose transport system permease protein n=1 Tax=Murimonas intestini TaxID=1337051 RepID=A0AB73T5I5_9FIRM|nr:sugar ABC transporter permease [Murimonas intestini]MCR1842170.1 sugar ABC transporter permease [Murimonas intestini]MCR1864906.1 sugar ABC transporter permease [Murimonas intestini]MCR1884234.1 sugar ABC transporter permease [Murimonas intestini]